MAQLASEKRQGPWVVDVKGERPKLSSHGYSGSGWEITIIRANNVHGFKSYGWCDADKLLIGHNGGPCRDQVHPFVWDALIKLAHKLANKLNREEAEV